MAPSVHRLTAGLRLRQLELLSTLADTRNMRAAAQRLHLTTAAVSKSLRETESLFDAELFHRTPSGLVPTAAGEIVVQRARVLLNELAGLADELAQRGQGDRLALGSPPFLAWTLVPRLLDAMAQGGEAPPVRLVEGRLAEIGRQLEAGDIDVLITMNTPSELGGLKLDGFVIEPVSTEQWIVGCAPGHERALGVAGDGVHRWRELQAARWILPPRPTNARMMIEQLLLEQGLAPVTPHIESLNAITNLQLAERGLGLALIARSAARDALAAGRLRELAVEALPPAVPIVLVYRLREGERGALAALRAAAQRLRNPVTSD